MGWPTDQTLAKLMLEYRDNGVTFGRFIRRSIKAYSQFVVIMGSVIAALAWLNIPPLAEIMAAFACGALLRDLAWFKISKRQWPFRQRTTDWAEVERIADGEAAQ